MNKISIPKTFDNVALFFDVDGTLLNIASKPDAITVPSELPVLLQDLGSKTKGAVALVTGREIAFIDRIFPAVKLVVSGLHGAELRTLDGVIDSTKPSDEFLNAKEYLQQKAAYYPGVIFEDKCASVALHYRNASNYEAHVKASLAQAAIIAGSKWQIQYGKMVAELRPADCDKGNAIVQLMQSEPFKGRIPYAFGDDLTDEDMFLACTRFGGAGIRIAQNNHNSIATHSISSPEKLHLFLKHILEQPEGTDIVSSLNGYLRKD